MKTIFQEKRIFAVKFLNMSSQDIVSGFRKALQDLLVPEIKAMQAELKFLNEKIDKVSEEMNRRFEQVDRRFEQVDKRFEQVETKIDNLHKDFSKMQLTQEKILDKLDLDKRITRLETLIEQVMKKAA